MGSVESKAKLDAYLYGMTVLSTIHMLDGSFPEADTYREIRETYVIPGGETANSAVILKKLGLDVKMDGPFLGRRTRDGILDFCSRYGIDCSGMRYDPDFDGVEDLVLVDGSTRTIFGKFGKYFSSGKRWTKPDSGAISSASIVALDPFFGEESEETAAYCIRDGKPYVTIDCPPEGMIHRNSAATVISNEYIKGEYPGSDIAGLFRRYAETTGGLVVFTFGSREILFGRRDEEIKTLAPFKVDVKSTLGAGDTFRAGMVYGIFKKMTDEETVRFAAATAASVCRRFPMALDPPGLDEISELAASERERRCME